MRRLIQVKRTYVYASLVVLILLTGLAVVFWQINSQPITNRLNKPVADDTDKLNPELQSSQTDETKDKTKTSKDNSKASYAAPTKQFKERITKKRFGTYVEPGNSPVSPERFQGYHTGVDVEFGDIEGDVAVKAVAAGEVIASQYVSGYGGAVAVRSDINRADRVVIYGHLDSNRLPSVGMQLDRAEQIGYLGRGFSNETAGERKHLHLAIVRSSQLNWAGYVSSKSALSGWINPLSLF